MKQILNFNEEGLKGLHFFHRAEMQRTQINNYCNNEATRLDTAVLARICTALDCRIEDLNNNFLIWSIISSQEDSPQQVSASGVSTIISSMRKGFAYFFIGISYPLRKQKSVHLYV